MQQITLWRGTVRDKLSVFRKTVVRVHGNQNCSRFVSSTKNASGMELQEAHEHESSAAIIWSLKKPNQRCVCYSQSRKTHSPWQADPCGAQTLNAALESFRKSCRVLKANQMSITSWRDSLDWRTVCNRNNMIFPSTRSGQNEMIG